MRFLIYFIIFFLCTLRSYGWGGKGHKMVATIAQSHLSKQIVDSVKYYLGDLTFEDAAVWMDQVSHQPSYAYMKTMHYINIPKDKTYVKGLDKTNIMTELDFVFLWLEKKESKDKTFLALKILFHLVGDIHQPLHVGYKEDRGGNELKVIYKGNSTKGKKSSLHKVWDSEMIETNNNFETECLTEVKHLLKTEHEKTLKIDSEQWLNESRKLIPDIYNYKDGIIGKEYIKKNTPVAVKQVSKAGLRLASVLKKYFER